jgi:hypothetical protein
MNLLSFQEIIRIREKYKSPVRRLTKLPKIKVKKPVGRPKKRRYKNNDQCFHWCPVCRRDWSHFSDSSAIDIWKKVCSNCKKEPR